MEETPSRVSQALTRIWWRRRLVATGSVADSNWGSAFGSRASSSPWWASYCLYSLEPHCSLATRMAAPPACRHHPPLPITEVGKKSSELQMKRRWKRMDGEVGRVRLRDVRHKHPRGRNAPEADTGAWPGNGTSAPHRRPLSNPWQTFRMLYRASADSTALSGLGAVSDVGIGGHLSPIAPRPTPTT